MARCYGLLICGTRSQHTSAAQRHTHDTLERLHRLAGVPLDKLEKVAGEREVSGPAEEN